MKVETPRWADSLITQVWQSLTFTLFASAAFFLCRRVFEQAPGFMTFYPQVLYGESQRPEDIFLDDSNPTITLTRLTVTTLMPSIIQNTCDFLWLSPYVFHSWFLQPFLQNQEARKGGFWEADVILFLDFDIWTFLYAIFISQQSYLLKNRKEI